jgi:hypothetical protein
MLLAKHKFKTVNCEACGRRVARKSRQQRYCSDRCRDFARRENKAHTAIKNPVLGQDTGQPTNPLKISSENNPLQQGKQPSIPLNLLGGYRWPDSIPVERQVLANIVRAEIGGAP